MFPTFMSGTYKKRKIKKGVKDNEKDKTKTEGEMPKTEY